MEVYVVYTEQCYGSSDQIKVFRDEASAKEYQEQLIQQLDCDVLANPFTYDGDVDGDVIYLTATELFYGEIEIHSTLEQAELRVANNDVDTIVIKRTI